MLDINNLYSYQKKIVNFLCSRKKCCIWAGCGLGKSISILTGIKFLLDKGKIKSALIVAPPNVVENVWKQEAEKWEHTKDLKISLVIGNEKQRIKALEEEADVYCLSRDLLYWLFQYDKYKFQFLCLDESSGFKDKKSRRFASLMQRSINTGGKKYYRKEPMISMFKYVCELTGTPASESYAGLWSQLQIISYGGINPLGKSLTSFREEYMIPQIFNGFPVYTKMKEGAMEKINQKLDESGMCISMRTEDYIELPEKIEIVRYITMKDKRYDEMKKNSVVTVDKTTSVIANSALDKINKTQQICSGFLYDEFGNAHTLNHDKEKALEEILEALDNEPVLILYRYEYEKDVLKKIGGIPLDNPKALNDWNKGRIKIGLLYPSNAYGLNIQQVCSVIIWYTQSLSGEQTEQAVKRIWRQGQTKNVRIFYLIFRNTVDEMVYNLIKNKKDVLDELLKHFSV